MHSMGAGRSSTESVTTCPSTPSISRVVSRKSEGARTTTDGDGSTLGRGLIFYDAGKGSSSTPRERPLTERTGGCLCGDVRFRLVGAPYRVDYCHCYSCRKHTGAPVAAFADCRAGVVEFMNGAPALYESSPGVRRGFCARCGSTLTYE